MRPKIREGDAGKKDSPVFSLGTDNFIRGNEAN